MFAIAQKRKEKGSVLRMSICDNKPHQQVTAYIRNGTETFVLNFNIL